MGFRIEEKLFEKENLSQFKDFLYKKSKKIYQPRIITALFEKQ